MSWTDPKWKYTPVAEQKAGYLAEKFKKIRAEQKKEAAKHKAPVVASIEPKGRTA